MAHLFSSVQTHTGLRQGHAKPNRLPWQMWRLLILAVALLGISMSAPSGITAASAQATHATRAQTATADPPCSGCGTGPLVPKGGPVQHHPSIFLDFWGPKWQQDTTVIPAIVTLFQSLAGGQYNNILTQYYDSAGPIANDAALNAVLLDANGQPVTSRMIDPATPVSYYPGRMTMDDIGTEALHFLATHGWSYNADTQVLVFPQQGTSYDQESLGDACGSHDYGLSTSTLAYGLVRYTPDATKADGTPLCNFVGADPEDNMTKIAAHEYAEMATDPQTNHFESAWRSNDSSGDEVADLCNDYTFGYPSVNGPTIWVQELWSKQRADAWRTWGQSSLHRTARTHSTINIRCRVPSCKSTSSLAGLGVFLENQ